MRKSSDEGDRKTHQMSFKNSSALRHICEQDINEGCDAVIDINLLYHT